MKLRSLIVALLLTFTTSAFAHWFYVPARIIVHPGQISAEVVNTYAAPLICSGQVVGQIATGQVFTTYFYEQFIPMGGYRFAYVQAPFLPFLNGWANVNCRFAGIW